MKDDVEVKAFYRTCPCKNCVAPKRHPGCHSDCSDKREWDTKKDKLMQEIQAEKSKQYEATGFLVDSQLRVAKRLKMNKWR